MRKWMMERDGGDDEQMKEGRKKKTKDGLVSIGVSICGAMDETSNLDKLIWKDSWRTLLSISGISEVILTATSETVLMGVSGESAKGESGSVV
jgi:hypothetical protein